VERRPKPVTRKPGRRIEKRPAHSSPMVDLLSLPHIAEFIDYGEITLGEMYPIGCVAVAADEHNSLAMLVRRDGETLAQLLTRLDQAIAKALEDGIFTDEINPPR
jgi:hypothetical protein